MSGKLWIGMDVYFNTLSGGNRRWYSTLRQILPTPTAANNVVTYTGLFDVENGDGALLSGMTTQVYFVTSAARGVLTVPVGALMFADAQRGADGAMGRAGAAGSVPPGGPAAGSAQGERSERAGAPRENGGSSGAARSTSLGAVTGRAAARPAAVSTARAAPSLRRARPRCRDRPRSES